ncbi:MAG TPA: helix-turn-helix transcriptional regulator [Clostridiales bacterium]|jgi:transcriptional regulator with XRE-family HTH domain|nr:helix-turn-helix transcriptional regulator [Clostridiales bacterium]
MKKTLGLRISEYRRAKGITQEELAERLNVSPQAVSKWENDVCCPDIMLLPKLAEILGVSIDRLLSDKTEPETRMLPEEKRKSIDEMTLRIIVNSGDGDKVRMNLPMALVKAGLELGMQMPQISGNDALKNIDIKKILELVERGVYGKLIEVETADGDYVDIFVE